MIIDHSKHAHGGPPVFKGSNGPIALVGNTLAVHCLVNGGFDDDETHNPPPVENEQRFTLAPFTWLYENADSTDCPCPLHYDDSRQGGGTVCYVGRAGEGTCVARKGSGIALAYGYTGLYFDTRIRCDRLLLATDCFYDPAGHNFLRAPTSQCTGWLFPSISDSSPFDLLQFISSMRRPSWAETVYKKPRHTADWEMNRQQLDDPDSYPWTLDRRWLYAIGHGHWEHGCDTSCGNEAWDCPQKEWSESGNRLLYWQPYGSTPDEWDMSQLCRSLCTPFSEYTTDHGMKMRTYSAWRHQQFGPFQSAWATAESMASALDSIHLFDLKLYVRSHWGVIRKRRQQGSDSDGAEEIQSRFFINNQVWCDISNQNEEV